MTTTLPSFKDAKILIVGDIMLDRYWNGQTDRISPEAPVPVVKVGVIDDRLGGAANVARNISALGCSASLCGIIGDDTAGQVIMQQLEKENIENLLIKNKNHPTITKLRVLSRHQQLIRMDFEESLKDSPQELILNKLQAIIDCFDAVVLSDYAKGTLHNPQPIIQLCKQHSIPCFVDPKGEDFARYSGASFITPNRDELEKIVGKSDAIEGLFAKAENLRVDLNIQGILVTLSEKGMALIEKGKPNLHIPTAARDVFDVTGAGDTVIATLAASYAAKSNIEQAMQLANIAAGIVVSKLGTSTVTQEEILVALSNEDKKLEKGVATIAQLKSLTTYCKQRGEKIVFTNGCFDILHAGHVRYLKKAAELGDRLIVGINSDASVKELKGNSRPIVSLKERMEVIAALRCVDWIIPFEEETPINLIKEIKPDVLSKGGDYLAENIVGYDYVTDSGGEVIILPFVDGCSSTAIIEKITKNYSATT